MSTAVKLDRLNDEVPWLIEQYRAHPHWGRFDQAMDCMEQAAAGVAGLPPRAAAAGDSSHRGRTGWGAVRTDPPHRNRGA